MWFGKTCKNTIITVSAKLTLLQARHAIRRCSAEASCLWQNKRKPLTARCRSRQKGACKGLLMLSCIFAWLISWSNGMKCIAILFISCKTSLLGFSFSQLVLQCRCMLRLLCSKAAGTTPFLVEWRKELQQVNGKHKERACSISCWRWASSSSPRKRA